MGQWVGFGWGAIWFVFWIGIVYVKQQERMKLYDLLDKATREGRTIPPEMLVRLSQRPPRPMSNLGTGVILIAVSMGMFAVGVVHYYSDAGDHPRLFWGPFGMFPIPLFIGLALLLLAWLRKGGRGDL